MVVELSFSQGYLVATQLPQGLRADAHRKSADDNDDNVPWEWDSQSQTWRTPAMHYASVAHQLATSNTAWTNGVSQWTKVDWPRLDLPALRPDQTAAVTAWSESQRGYVVMATGTGKTEVAIAIMAQRQVSTLIVAPVRDLMHQWRRRIKDRTGYEAGVIGDSIRDERPITVTTYESAALHMHALGNRFGLIVFDECHHLPGERRQLAALQSAAPYRLGLTATPDGNHQHQQSLEQLVGRQCFCLSIREAAGSVLADYQVVRVPVELNATEREEYDQCAEVVRRFVSGRRRLEPDYRWERVFREANQDPRARLAIQAFRRKRSIEDQATAKLRVLEDLFRLHAGEPVIVFAGSNLMAREVSKRFLIPCLLNHCRAAERRDILEGLAAGDYPALVANQVLDEGLDLPEVNVAIVIGGTASPRQATQRLGRILRKNRYGDATLYEVVSAETSEVQRSRRRRRNDAFKRTLAG